MNKYEQPTVFKLKQLKDDAKDFRTFIFEGKIDAKPGQFVMVWLPGIDAKPIAISYQDGTEFHIAVLKVGSFTEKMMDLKIGDKVGFFGPYGTNFTITGQKICLIGGGCGTPPLNFLAYEAYKKGIAIDFIIGARSEEYLPYKRALEKSDFNVFFATDDGSYGYKGYTTDILEEKLKNNKYDHIYTCGPEIMMSKVIDLCYQYDIKCEISIERYMKCGFGICGQCSVDGEGIPICKKGPIFTKEYVKENIKEFNKYHRDSIGQKIKFPWA